MLLKNFFAKINFKKILRVRKPEIFENFFIKEQNSDVVFVGVFMCQNMVISMVKNMVLNMVISMVRAPIHPSGKHYPKNGDFLIKPLIVFFKKYN